jgi:integrase
MQEHKNRRNQRMPKLTKQVIDSHGKKEKLYTIWDTEVKGFGCRVQPSGKKMYIYLYRTRNDPKLKYLTIGVHGSITVDRAREIVKGYSADVARGSDPKQSSNIEIGEKIEKEITFKEFFEIFNEKHRLIENKESTILKENYYIKKRILPFFGEKKLNAISVKDVMDFKDVMKKVPGAYNRCIVTVNTALNKAIAWKIIPKDSNPCNNISLYPRKKMERFLSNDELKKLEALLNSEHIQKRYSKYTINAIKLLIYTGCRKNEVLSIKWEDVYLEESYFHLKDSKAGKRDVPLNEISKKILLETHRHRDNPYVFPSVRLKNNHIKDPIRLWNTIRNAIDCKDVRIHDLRHSFASFAIKKGIDIFRVSKLLGHKDIKTTMRYAHISKEDMISASNTVGEMFGNG